MEQVLKEYLNLLIPISNRMLKKGIKEAVTPVERKYGLSKIHMMYILALENKDMTATELSDYLMFDKSNTSRALPYLSENGFITDDRRSEGCRGYKISLTDTGHEVAKDMNEAMLKFIDKITSGVPDTHARDYLDTIERICVNIDQNNAGTITSLKESLGLPHDW